MFQKARRGARVAGERSARSTKTIPTSFWPSSCRCRSRAENEDWREGWRGGWIRREERLQQETWSMLFYTLSTQRVLQEPEAHPSPRPSWILLTHLTGQTPPPSLVYPAPSPSLRLLPPSAQSCWSWETAL